MLLKRLLPFVFLLIVISLDAQTLELYLVNVRVQVLSIDDGIPVAYAHVINPRVRGGTTTNADGYFTIQMLTEDTLIIRSMGYVDYHFFLNEFPPKDLYNIKMQPVRHLLNEVTVNERNRLKDKLGLPEAKPLDVPIGLRGASYNEKPPLLAAFLNPLSYAHYFLSEEEKRKRETLKVIKDEKQWNTFAIYHNLGTIKKLTGLDGDEADQFMIYCNINNRLPYFASQMEIEFQIMDFFFKYKKEQGK
jgi:hypothetical protein